MNPRRRRFKRIRKKRRDYVEWWAPRWQEYNGHMGKHGPLEKRSRGISV